MENSEKAVLGVIGGMGPMATVRFLQKLVAMTDAKTDQEHIDTIIYNFPSIPDRTGYILKKSSEDPVPPIVQIGESLCSQGAKYIAIPCITAHCFHGRISQGVNARVINAVIETAQYLKANGVTCAGITATDGTIGSKLFEDALKKAGITPVVPSGDRQKDVMSLIYDDIKANREPDIEKFRRVVNELKEKGAQTVILGCTELSLIKRPENLGVGFIDVLDVLAKRSVELCGGKVKPEFADLIK